MSGTFPLAPLPSFSAVGDFQKSTTRTGGTGKQQTIIKGGHLWRVDCRWPVMTRDEFAPMFAFSASQAGDSFQISVPPHDKPIGTTATRFLRGPSQVSGTCPMVLLLLVSNRSMWMGSLVSFQQVLCLRLHRTTRFTWLQKTVTVRVR